MASFDDGKPVPLIIQEKTNGPFVLQEEALKSLLLCPEAKDKPVCVVAIAGAFRKGKSFLMNFFRRYCLNKDSDDWLDEGTKPSNGFNWKQGRTRETTGIMAWSKPLICKNGKGEEVAIIFVDSQGTFDPQASNKESTVVFALTAMFSSILIYNLTSNIQENHLSDLQTFMVYGKSVAEACGSSQAFQSLLLLVRDWEFPNDLEYGYDGGQNLLNDVLKVDHEQAATQRETREDIKKCFSNINCYLMPHPGSKVNKDANFAGRIDQMKPEFLRHLRLLVPSLLHPDNLVKKQFKGKVMSGQQLFDLFKNFVNMIREMDLPEPFAFAEAAARSSSETARDAALEKYKMIMKNYVGEFKISISPDKLENWHLKSVKEAVEVYVQKNKIGEMRERIFKEYQDSLGKLMSDLHKECGRTNMKLAEWETATKKQEEREKAVKLEAERKQKAMKLEAEERERVMKLEAEKKLKLEKERIAKMEQERERMIKLEQEREKERRLDAERRLVKEREDKSNMEREMKKLEIVKAAEMETQRQNHQKELASERNQMQMQMQMQNMQMQHEHEQKKWEWQMKMAEAKKNTPQQSIPSKPESGVVTPEADKSSNPKSSNQIPEVAMTSNPMSSNQIPVVVVTSKPMSSNQIPVVVVSSKPMSSNHIPKVSKPPKQRLSRHTFEKSMTSKHRK